MPAVLRIALALAVLALSRPAVAQTAPSDTAFADRAAILRTIEAVYLGDHAGSADHKRASCPPEGAFRYVGRDGAHCESRFRLAGSQGDTLYTEELLSVEIC